MVTEAISLAADAKARLGYILSPTAHLATGLLPFNMNAAARPALAAVFSALTIRSSPNPETGPLCPRAAAPRRVGARAARTCCWAWASRATRRPT